MKISSYGRFRNPVAIGGLPILNTHGGKVIWVDSGGGGGIRGTYKSPMLTTNAAMDLCTANNGDIIIAKPGHAETISEAGGITFDVAGVTFISLGVGADRTEWTFGTDVGASVVVSAANVSILNVVGISGIDSLTNPFHVQAADCVLDFEWQDSSSAVEAVRAVLTTAAADRFVCKLKYRGQTGGDACVNAIRLVGCDGGDIHVDFYGIASTSIIEFLTTACSDIDVSGIFYNSGTTDLSKNVVDTVTGSTWSVKGFDAAAAASFSGGSGSAVASDDVSALSARVPSIVLKSTGDLTASGLSVALFTVTGDVLCKVGGSVDVALTCTSGTSTAEVGVAGNTAALCVQDAIDGVAFQVGDSWTLITAADANAAQMADEWVLVGNGVDIIMTVSVDDITAGDIDFYCQYIPLTSGSSVVAA